MGSATGRQASSRDLDADPRRTPILGDGRVWAQRGVGDRLVGLGLALRTMGSEVRRPVGVGRGWHTARVGTQAHLDVAVARCLGRQCATTI